VTWVMFDYGGVISQPLSAEDVALLAGVAGVSVPALLAEYWKWRPAYDLAELDAKEYWQQVGSGLRREFGGGEISELVRLDSASWLRLQAGTVALIEDLAGAAHPLALLSNAPGELATEIAGLPVAAHFGHLIFSCQLKLAKPDPRCYSRALAQLGADPDEVIFIDDRDENVAAAAAMGLSSVHFTSPDETRAAVTRLLAEHG
jgi:putative hydrolase of the HAD superfamily